MAGPATSRQTEVWWTAQGNAFQNVPLQQTGSWVLVKMVGSTGFEPVAPTMSMSSRNAQIDIFHKLARTYENRQVRTKTEQNGIYRQVSAKPTDVYAKV